MRCILSFIVLASAISNLTAQPTVHNRSGEPLHGGDIIRLKVWREPDLTGDINVNGEGFAAIPRIGTVRVDSTTPDSLRRLIVNTYKGWLVDPAIEVTFLRRLRVFGAVQNPGMYSVDEGLTIADAIAMAGGVHENGSYDNVQLVRGPQRSAIHVTRVTKLADLNVQSGDEVYVPQRSWLSRNSATLAGSAIAGLAIFFAALIHG